MKTRHRLIWVGALALTLLFVVGCGHDKNLDPYSKLVYDGPDPASVKVDVDPANTHLQYFDFHIELNNSDPSSNLSILPKDAWTIDSADGTFTINDPGGYITQPLPDIQDSTPTPVSSSYPMRYQITLLTQQWLQDNASGIIGTTDVATVTLDITFHAHRNRDGLQKTISDQFQFTISDY